jgi:hypothetical protein
MTAHQDLAGGSSAAARAFTTTPNQYNNDPFRAGEPLEPRLRFVFALTIAVISGAACAWLISRPGYTADLLHVWYASRVLSAGGDPYATSLPYLNPGQDPALYPLPSYLAFAPFALASLPIAGALFLAVGAGLAAWGIGTTGVARAPLFISAPFLLAVSLGQWSPLLVGAILVPGASWLLVTKPNLGLAAWLARPRWTTALAILGIIALSIAVYPAWPAAWLKNVSGREEKIIPLLQPGGFLLLASAVAWRRVEGRLLLALSFMPQAMFFYDQLLLCLVPRTSRQAMVFSLFSFAAFLAWWQARDPGDRTVNTAVPYAQSLYYAAALILLWNAWRDRAKANS